VAKKASAAELSTLIDTFTALPLEQQREVLGKITDSHNDAKEKRRLELVAELSEWGFTAPARSKAKADTATKRASPKAQYRSPDGTNEWSGRGAIPGWATALGVTDRAGLEPYRIQEQG
jgi:DNA-binding protein H-NS